MRPQVSVIVINYNTFDLTSVCIKSIYEKTRAVTFELILVDNASSECDAENFKSLFPEIILIKNPINTGFSRGNNIGISHANAEIFLLLNSDTVLLEDSISICYHELMLKETTGAITCKLIYPDNSIQHNCQSFPSLLKSLIEKLRLHKLLSKPKRSDFLQGVYWDYSQAGNPDWIWGTFFMFRKNLLPKITNRKLNEDFFMYQEDMQWCLDFKKAGYKIAYVSNTAILHYMGGSPKKTTTIVQNNYNIFLKKNYSYLKYLLLKR